MHQSIQDGTTRERLQLPIVATFFLSWKYPLRRENGSAKGPFFRALIYKVLESMPSMIPRLCRAPCTSLNSARPEEGDHRYYQCCLSSLLSIVAKLNTIYILVDGLDEYEPDVQDDILECIDFIRDVPQLGYQVGVAISSRWLQRIDKGYNTIRLYVDTENSADIAAFCSTVIVATLAGLKRTDIQLSNVFKVEPLHSGIDVITGLQDALDYLIQKADGCFHWARLAIDKLCDSLTLLKLSHHVRGQFRQTVQELPGDLHRLYSNMLDRVPINSKPISRLILLWSTLR